MNIVLLPLAFSVSKSCVSAASVQSVPITSWTILGFSEVPEGITLTDDECTIDWDCTGDRCCTYGKINSVVVKDGMQVSVNPW